MRHWLMMGALVLSCHAVAGPALRVGIQEDSSPKFVGSTVPLTERVEGLCPDILRAIEKQSTDLRFEFEAQRQPLRRIELRMEQAQADVNCLVDNDARRAKFRVMPIVLFNLDYHLIARADDAVQVEHWDDIRRLGPEGKMLVLSGTGVMERLNKLGGLRVEESGKSVTANLRKLVQGRARFFYYRTHDWNSQLQAAGVTGQVRILPARMEAVRFYLMMGRHVPQEVAAQTERALQALEANGTLAQLRVKWQVDAMPAR